MELDELKSNWNKLEIPAKTTAEMQWMLKENKHPVLKGIRKQLTIEIIVWSAFLLCYYTMFDGHRKPALINTILVTSVLFSLIHNFTGYRFAKYLVNGTTIKASLEYYLSKLKIYAMVSIVSRLLFMAGLLLFFTYKLSFTASRYMLLVGVVLVFLVQLAILYRIWAKRLTTLRTALSSLTG